MASLAGFGLFGPGNSILTAIHKARGCSEELGKLQDWINQLLGKKVANPKSILTLLISMEELQNEPGCHLNPAVLFSRVKILHDIGDERQKGCK